MGNCLISGMGDVPNKSSPIRVTTSNGGIMEFDSPVTVESITDEFPGHGIFRSHDLFLNPLPHTELLLPGESYHLLLLAADRHVSGGVSCNNARATTRHSRSSSAPPQQLASNSGTTPYRMSFDSRGMKRKILSIWDDSNVAKCGDGNNERMVSRKFDDGYCKSSHGGFWKVKLVISPEQLMEILSEEGKTEELIESVRTVAKCGSNVGGGGGYCSDQWSRSSSRNAASSTNQD